MKKQLNKWIMFSFITGCLIFGSAQFVQAQLVTFAQYLEKNGTKDYIFTNNTNSASFQTISGESEINFFYTNVSGLPAELQGLQDAHLLTTSTTTQQTFTSGTINQPFNSVYEIQILRDTAASIGSGARRNLLTIRFSPSTSPASLSGSQGGNSASLSATTPDQVVVFTSDFLNFNNTTQRNLALNFTSVTPSLQNNTTNNFLQSFTAVGGGSASSNPAPSYNAPTAAPANISGRILSSRGLGIGRVKIELLDTVSGETRQTQSRGDGSYSFEGVSAGQLYILTASRFRFIFEPSSMPIQVDGDIQDLNFNVSRSFWNGR